MYLTTVINDGYIVFAVIVQMKIGIGWDFPSHPTNKQIGENIMSKKGEATREDARRILRNGILDMSVARLIQMSQFGLMGNIELRKQNGSVFVNNMFNRIEFNEDTRCIAFSVREACMEDNNYGSIAFCVDSIIDISGCDDKYNPEEYLNVNIKLQDNTAITIKILY